ncbi:MAG TPA: NAD(P)/FAD-dependent oxidoreductase [Roseateles sp.]
MNTPTPPLKTLVIAGGGFAGTTLARALEARLPAGWQLVLLSEESYTTFNPMLAEVVGAAVFPEHVIAPIREMLASTQFIMGRLERVDHAGKTLSCTTLAGPLELRFDHLVLAFGQRANLNIIPGLAEHALPLKLVGDAMHIRNRLLQRLAHIELCHNKAQRRSLGHFVVIGGGFSGVEVAGAVVDFLRSAHRCYRRVKAHELRVTLLHDGERLLPELPAALGVAAAKSLGERGVDVRLGAKAASVDACGVDLACGERIPSATVVCTIGARSNPLVETLGVETLRGRIVTDPDGQVPNRPGLWALGDCAATLNLADGKPCPPTAQFAVAQARQLARNLLRHLAGQPTRPFSHSSRGMMATTGHHRGVAELLGVRLTGLPAWLAWRAYYLMRMPTLGRKVRIWVEWTWSLFFAADVTHLRFTRTGDVDPPRQPRIAANDPQHL